MGQDASPGDADDPPPKKWRSESFQDSAIRRVLVTGAVVGSCPDEVNLNRSPLSVLAEHLLAFSFQVLFAEARNRPGCVSDLEITFYWKVVF